MREQEVLRANRELAAYFRGRRTEREARAALKIIKAFVRHRERLDQASRSPLPGSAAALSDVSKHLRAGNSDARHPVRPTRTPRRTMPKTTSASNDPPADSEQTDPPGPARRKPE